MRVILLHFLPTGSGKNQDILKNLEKGALSNGHQIVVKDGTKDRANVRLTMYEYVAVIVSVTGLFGGKIPPKVAEVLAGAGTVSGKKGCALVVKSGLSSAKTCKTLMKAMEKEGVFLDYSDIIENAGHAVAVGRKIG